MNIWRLITHHEEGEEAAKWSRRVGEIAIGFGNTGDLSKRCFSNATELTKIIATDSPHSSVSNTVNGGRSLWQLCREMQIGDLVILSAGSGGVCFPCVLQETTSL